MPLHAVHDHIQNRLNEPRQFAYENGMVVTEVRDGYAKGELHPGPNIINPHGNVHGGALATLADIVAGSCACSRGGHCVTSNMTLEYLRPAYPDRMIYCEATPKKMGRSLSVIQVEITDEKGSLLVTGTYTFFMFDS